MNAVVTNVHHFSRGVTLTIENGKPKWRLDHSRQSSRPSESAKETILDPTNSIEDFLQLLSIAYMFVGTLGNQYSRTVENDLKIESEDNLTQWDIVNFIYKIPLEHEIKLVRFSQCGCNMGHCGALVGVNVDDKVYTTYGDVISTFAFDKITSNDGNEVYWMYPDSVFLYTERIYELPKQIHSKASCYSEKVDLNLDLEFEQDVIYLSWEYSR